MCDAVMCEDIAGYYKRGPLYFITSQQSSPAFLLHSSEAQPDQTRFPVCPHEGLLSFNLHFPLLCPPLRNWFSCSLSCKGVLFTAEMQGVV